jgi:hypothetical protein
MVDVRPRRLLWASGGDPHPDPLQAKVLGRPRQAHRRREAGGSGLVPGEETSSLGFVCSPISLVDALGLRWSALGNTRTAETERFGATED